MNKVILGMGTCGLASGAEEVKNALEKWASEKGVPLSITPSGCVGFCQMEPIMDLFTPQGNRVSYGKVSPENIPFILHSFFAEKHYNIDGLIGQYRNGKTPLAGIPFIDEHPFFKKQVKFVLGNCGVINPTSLSEYKESGGLRGLEKALTLSPEEVINEIINLPVSLISFEIIRYKYIPLLNFEVLILVLVSINILLNTNLPCEL